MVGFTFLEMEAKVPVKKSIMKPLSPLPPCLVSTHLSDEPLILFIISQQITFLFFVLYMWFKTPVTNVHYLYFFGQHRKALGIFTEEFLCLLFFKKVNFYNGRYARVLYWWLSLPGRFCLHKPRLPPPTPPSSLHSSLLNESLFPTTSLFKNVNLPPTHPLYAQSHSPCSTISFSIACITS